MVRKWSTVPISLSYTTPTAPTDNCPQPKEALPTVSQLDVCFFSTPRLCSLIDGPEVEHGAHFLSYTTPTAPCFEPVLASSAVGSALFPRRESSNRTTPKIYGHVANSSRELSR
jgi:hypothetical protein